MKKLEIYRLVKVCISTIALFSLFSAKSHAAPDFYTKSATVPFAPTVGKQSDLTYVIGNKGPAYFNGLSANSYSWLNDGLEITVTNSNTYEETEAGIYTCQVTNPALPLLTLTSEPVTITYQAECLSHGVTCAEYNALVALYNNTNGAGWTNNTNWLSDEP
ncbi:MAG: hypothetical protein JXB34_15435, partial [Bacteroidales bacterium]|nr:hypothetical protein [Bacteroidales bacterium]